MNNRRNTSNSHKLDSASVRRIKGPPAKATWATVARETTSTTRNAVRRADSRSVRAFCHHLQFTIFSAITAKVYLYYVPTEEQVFPSSIMPRFRKRSSFDEVCLKFHQIPLEKSRKWSSELIWSGSSPKQLTLITKPTPTQTQISNFNRKRQTTYKTPGKSNNLLHDRQTSHDAYYAIICHSHRASDLGSPAWYLQSFRLQMLFKFQLQRSKILIDNSK